MVRMISVLAAGMLALGAVAAAQTSDSEKSAAPGLPPGMAIRAELDHPLDSKKAKVGESVVARTTEDVKEDGKVVLPKGSKVTGHVIQASARSKGDNNSRLALAFDRAQPKGGQEMPLEVNLQALAAAPEPAAPIGGRDLEAAGSPNSATGMPNRSGGMSGAGTSNRPPTPTPQPPDSIPTGGGSMDSRGASGPIKSDAHGVIGLDGLSLEAAANSPQNSVIVSSGKSVHLDGGTRLLLVTQAQAN